MDKANWQPQNAEIAQSQFDDENSTVHLTAEKKEGSTIAGMRRGSKVMSPRYGGHEIARYGYQLFTGRRPDRMNFRSGLFLMAVQKTDTSASIAQFVFSLKR